MVRLDQVTRRFERSGTVTALNGVSLTIRHGELVSIVGPSGSGKSTLLNLMGALDRPTTGDVQIDGTSLSRLSESALTRLRRDKIGIVFQFFNLLPSLTAVENVALPLHLRGWRRNRAVARAEELLALVGLGDRLAHRPDELSGGQRQRVAIARALGANPPLLLADEPTGNLDSQTGTEILTLIHDVHLAAGCTVVLVTHDEGVAHRCDRVITLRDGHVIRDFTAEPARTLRAAR